VEAHEIPELEYMHELTLVMSVGKRVFLKINKWILMFGLGI